MFFVMGAYICAFSRLEVGSSRPRDSGGPAGAFVQQTSGIDGNMEGKNMKLSAITVMTALSAMMLSGCGDSAVKNLKDLHPGINFESASKFLDKYGKENNCSARPISDTYLVRCKDGKNLDVKNVSNQNIFDFTVHIYADEKGHVVRKVEKGAYLTNVADMDRAFDELRSNARKEYGDDGWNEKTTNPQQSLEVGGRTLTIGVKSTSIRKEIKNKVVKSISKEEIYNSQKGESKYIITTIEEIPKYND
jgi:hypothetical protein